VPSAEIVLLAARLSPQLVGEGIRAGARGFVVKSILFMMSSASD